MSSPQEMAGAALRYRARAEHFNMLNKGGTAGSPSLFKDGGPYFYKQSERGGLCLFKRRKA